MKLLFLQQMWIYLFVLIYVNIAQNIGTYMFNSYNYWHSIALLTESLLNYHILFISYFYYNQQIHN
jgi:hypothetical protein